MISSANLPKFTQKLLRHNQNSIKLYAICRQKLMMQLSKSSALCLVFVDIYFSPYLLYRVGNYWNFVESNRWHCQRQIEWKLCVSYTASAIEYSPIWRHTTKSWFSIGDIARCWTDSTSFGWATTMHKNRVQNERINNTVQTTYIVLHAIHDTYCALYARMNSFSHSVRLINTPNTHTQQKHKW